MDKLGFSHILNKMCDLFSTRIGEPVITNMVGYETIQLTSSELDYPKLKDEVLPEVVLCHMFICGDWSGYAIVNIKQTKLFAMGTFYGSDYHES